MQKPEPVNDLSVTPCSADFAVGDAVQKNYGDQGWGTVCFVRGVIDGKRYQLAQECWPSSHFSYAWAGELRRAVFTEKQHPELQQYRRAAMAEALPNTEVRHARANNPTAPSVEASPE